MTEDSGLSDADEEAIPKVLDAFDPKRNAVATPQVGILPEGCELYNRLSGQKHLESAIESEDDDDDPEALLDRVGLAQDVGDRPVGEYSTGMRQRLPIALSLINDPGLLILDEPSSGLDPDGIKRLREIVLKERDDRTTVSFSSHILEQVEAVCDRIAILVNGELRASGAVDTLKSDIGLAILLDVEINDVSDELTTALGAMEAVFEWDVRQQADSGYSIEVHLTDSDEKAAILRTFKDHTTVGNFTTEEPTLESLFEKHVTEVGR